MEPLTPSETGPCPPDRHRSRRKAWGALLILLGAILSAGGAWLLWRAVIAPEGISPPADLTLRHVEEEGRSLTRRGEVAPDEPGAQKPEELARAREKWRAEHDELKARHAAEREAARSTARRRELVGGLALALGAVVLLGMGYDRWRRPAPAGTPKS